MSAFRPRSTPLFLRTFSVQSKKAATPGQVGREEERKNPVSFLGTLLAQQPRSAACHFQSPRNGAPSPSFRSLSPSTLPGKSAAAGKRYNVLRSPSGLATALSTRG